MTALPLLGAANWGIAIALLVVFLFFLGIAYVILQETRAQLYWRKLVEQGDVSAIETLVKEEVERWKTARTPRAVPPSVWHGVQSVELLEVQPDGLRLGASAEGQYALSSGERREVSSALQEGMKLTAQLADMAMYEIPNVKLGRVQIDIYSTYRDERSATQRCILSTVCERSVAETLDWDELDGEQIVRSFGGRFRLDDRGNALPIDPEGAAPPGVPAAYYEDA
jgi:hypothetical protein